MRSFILAALVLLLDPAISIAKTGNADAIAIEGQLDAFIASWNRHDFSDMPNYIAEDCDFVNVKGSHWKGREDIQYAHQYFHQLVFPNTPMKKQSVIVRFLKPDVAIAHMVWQVGPDTVNPFPATPKTKPDGSYNDLATVIFIKRKGVWLITAMENVVIDEELALGDPIRLRNLAK